MLTKNQNDGFVLNWSNTTYTNLLSTLPIHSPIQCIPKLWMECDYWHE